MSGSDLSPVKQALIELRELRSRIAELERADRQPIAIIGIGCRLPGGVGGPDDLWRLLSQGIDAVGEVPPDRWNAADFYDPDVSARGKMSTRWGGFIDSVDRFDPAFFGISPREACSIDPQHRLLLEVAWEALEHANQAPDRLAGSSTGVFVGISGCDYVHLSMGAPAEGLGPHLAPGIAHSAASGRIAYALGLQGPAISVDTACSSSLMALHLAVQSMRSGECQMALVGGVNVILLPTFMIGFSKSQMMAADGRCKAFDSAADGFVRGEGCGVLVLKRLADAERDGDNILAVIRGSAVNQDGRSSGMTAPNGLAQEAVIRAALQDAAAEGNAIGYIEAHGTGTALGDPVEIQAIAAALGEGRDPGQPVLIGSLKTNLGHLEAAAGVTGVIKAALALKHGAIPPSLHFREPNPHVPWEGIPVRVVAATTPFPLRHGRRLAGVSSFGFTGTNVHVILEAAEGAAVQAADHVSERIVASTPRNNGSDPPRHDEPPFRLLKLSAREEPALDSLADRWSEVLEATEADLAGLCFSANVGRADLTLRRAAVARSAAEAGDMLRRTRRGEAVAGVLAGRVRRGPQARAAFLFTGHGAHYLGMGQRLLQTEPVFRKAMESCDSLLRPFLDTPLLSVLYPGMARGGRADAEVGGGSENGAGRSPHRGSRGAERERGSQSSLLDSMAYSQAALFSLQYALTQLWKSWGIEPTAVLGHSVGEYAAAVAAGVLDVADAVKLVTSRGRLMDSVPEDGAMLAIFAAESDVAPLLRSFAGAVSIASINGPQEVVLSGARSAIESIEMIVSRAQIDFRRLEVSCAAHSSLLDPVLDEFEEIVRSVRLAPPLIPLVSSTTGGLVDAAEITASDYWRRHLREEVRFAAGLETLRDEGCGAFVEIGPHTNLLGMGRRCLPDESLVWLPSLNRRLDDRQQMLESLASLYVNGAEVDWRAVEGVASAPAATRPSVRAPTYPWQHQRFWLEHDQAGALPPRQGCDSSAVWERITEAGERQAAQGPLDLALSTFPARWKSLDRLTTAIAGNTLAGLGSTSLHGEWTERDLIQRLGLIGSHERLMTRWLHRLARADKLGTTQSGGFVTHVAPSDEELTEAWADATTHCGDWPFLLEYLRRCETLLPGVLTGSVDPVETVFPGGSFATADALYSESVLPRYFNALAGAVVGALLQSRPGERIRALEVGAGTGGTTATLLPLVDRAGGSYLFTDVSELFLTRAAEKFGAFSSLQLALLDVQEEPTAQGFAAGTFDLIVAANVLHATSNIRQTLARLRTLQSPGGFLLLIEVTTYLDWFDVSTALLEGWDLQDDDMRSDHPMLSRELWTELLNGAGFAGVAAFPSPGSPAEVMAQHVVVGMAPGNAVLRPARQETDGSVVPEHHGDPAVRPRAESPADYTRRVEAASPREREELLIAYVREHVAALLRLPDPARIERGGRLMDLGLDSLLAVELRGRLSGGIALSQELPSTLAFDFPTVQAIASLLSEMLVGTDAGPYTAVSEIDAGAVEASNADTALDHLSDAEVEDRLLARLQAMEGPTP